MNINISGNAVLTSAKGYAIREIGNADDQTNVVTLTVAGGTLTGASDQAAVSVRLVSEDTVSVSGGIFSSQVPVAYCAEGYEPATLDQATGKYSVQIATGKNVKVVDADGNDLAAYDDLAAALTHAASGQKVVLLADATLAQKVDTGVTIVVPESMTLTVDTASASTILQQSAGAIDIQAGGSLRMPDSQGAVETFVGKNTDARMILTSGSAVVDFSANSVILRADSMANIPEGKTYYIVSPFLSAAIEAGATLTVNGQLTLANTTTLTVNGALDVASGGLVRVNSQAALAGSGTVTNAGKITLHQGGSNTATVQPTITLTSGGEVYSQFALTDGKVASSSKSTGNYTVAGIVAEDGATLLTFTEKYTYYVPSTSGGSSGSTTYTITVSKADNGAVTVSSKAASKGRTVTITVKPDEGYALESLTVTDRNGKELELTDKGGGKYTFTMPASRVTVDALFAEIEPVHTCPAEKFTDVDVDDWFHEAVDYVVENGMMNGVSDTAFAPEATTTRGMIVTVLYRLEGNPKTGPSDFEDVASHAWYADSVAWACANGIVNGYGNGSFGPEDMITREQVATILYRYASYKGYDLTARADLSVYNDNNTVSGYAEAAMNWAVGEELFQGVGASLLSPSTSATRSQIATILMRFCENVAK